MQPFARLLVVSSAVLLARGCDDGAQGSDAFATSPASVVTTDSGALRLAIFSAPEAAPSRGVNALRLVATRVADGSRAGGLAIELVPWMPAMGHGTSVTPRVTADAAEGSYTVTNVDLFMAGRWELRTTIRQTSDAGRDPTTDHAAPAFDIR
jgi:hypothetical protein